MNSQRLWGVALGVSLTVNAFCIAALITNVFTPRLGPDHGRPSLPTAAHALFREIDPREQPGFRESIQALRQHRSAVRTALSADPFDAEKLAAAFAKLRQAETQKAAHAHQKIAEVAASLSPEQRAQLARFIGRRRGPPSDRGHHGWRSPPADPD